ncbi:orotate phosphoribosyltransferase, partial [Candidatus Peregrinibacteria bacterium]|nr:orotate phosphoribosyltransferase [Candidatus Peregrinibacteria bacterium]
VEGDIPHGKDIVLIEDLFSTGGSAISSVEALREEVDGNVSDVIAIFTYEMLASTEKAQSASVKLHPLASLSILLKVAGDQGRLTKEDISKVAEFSSDPKAWGEKL